MLEAIQVDTRGLSGIAGARPTSRRWRRAKRWMCRSSCIRSHASLAAGQRLRLTIAGADADNLIVPTQGCEATLAIHVGGERGARLLLPIVNESVTPTAHIVEGGFNGGSGGFAFRRPDDPPLTR